MKGLFFMIVILTGQAFTARSQNLVPNAGFEEIFEKFCGDFPRINRFESTIKYWVSPTKGIPRISDKTVSADCRNAIHDSDLVQPHADDRMVRLCVLSNSNYRTYIEVPLIEPLQKGEMYYTSMWIRFDSTRWDFASNNIGMYFSESEVRVLRDTATGVNNVPFMTVLNFKPQINHSELAYDSKSWVRLTAAFVAQSNYRYVTIGNFFPDNKTKSLLIRARPFSDSVGAFVYVDDIYVGRQMKD